jgi:hypothetical protein
VVWVRENLEEKDKEARNKWKEEAERNNWARGAKLAGHPT